MFNQVSETLRRHFLELIQFHPGVPADLSAGHSRCKALFSAHPNVALLRSDVGFVFCSFFFLLRIFKWAKKISSLTHHDTTTTMLSLWNALLFGLFFFTPDCEHCSWNCNPSDFRFTSLKQWQFKIFEQVQSYCKYHQILPKLSPIAHFCLLVSWQGWWQHTVYALNINTQNDIRQ